MDVNILTYNTHGLPWSRDRTKEICDWIAVKQPHILCLQEVFTSKSRAYYTKFLNHAGYTMIIPEDTQISDETEAFSVSPLSSGLLTGFLRSKYSLESSVFCPYQSYHNVESLANKGFQVLRVRSRITQTMLIIINTHTQSNTEVSFFFGSAFITTIRIQQFQQILDFVHGLTSPVLVCGDLNCERSPHSELRFITPLHQNLFHKSTFYSTGEDLDHVGWILPQYAPKGCELCDVERYGPILKNCQIYQLSYSDHAPVEFDIRVPLLRR